MRSIGPTPSTRAVGLAISRRCPLLLTTRTRALACRLASTAWHRRLRRWGTRRRRRRSACASRSTASSTPPRRSPGSGARRPSRCTRRRRCAASSPAAAPSTAARSSRCAAPTLRTAADAVPLPLRRRRVARVVRRRRRFAPLPAPMAQRELAVVADETDDSDGHGFNASARQACALVGALNASAAHVPFRRPGDGGRVERDAHEAMRAAAAGGAPSRSRSR